MFLSPAWRRSLHVAGGLLALIGLIYLALRLSRHASDLPLERLTPFILASLGVLALFQALANSLLAEAWRRLCHFLGMQLDARLAQVIYASSLVAKYVPGNVFQFAGRQALCAVEGLPAGPTLKSAGLELGLLAVVGAMLGILALPLMGAGSAWVSWVMVGMVSLAVAWMLLVHTQRDLLVAGLLQGAFLAGSGVCFLLVLILLTGQAPAAPLEAVVSAYVLAWLAGLLTPGAPAGLGVREVAVLWLLRGVAPEQDLLLAVLLTRLVTVSGDALSFLFGQTLRLRTRPHPTPD